MRFNINKFNYNRKIYFKENLDLRKKNKKMNLIHNL